MWEKQGFNDFSSTYNETENEAKIKNKAENRVNRKKMENKNYIFNENIIIRYFTKWNAVWKSLDQFYT